MIFGAMYEQRSSLESPNTPMNSQELAEYLGAANGITVSPAMAQKLTAVYACIYVLSSTMAQLPLNVLRKVDGNIVPATDHPTALPVWCAAVGASCRRWKCANPRSLTW